MRFIPYLNFDGRCREAFAFYERILDGKILSMLSHGDTPAGAEVPDDWQDLIINAYLVADGAEIMGADAPAAQYQPAAGTTISIHLEDGAEARAERIFNAFADGGVVKMAFGPTFWAKRFGMVTDRYGTPWMINCGMVEQ